MANYSIYLDYEWEKYELIKTARDAGATVTGVSGCGSGYYIQIDATPAQAAYIDKCRYTADMDEYTPERAWAAWKRGALTVGQMATWQQRHNVYFDEKGARL